MTKVTITGRAGVPAATSTKHDLGTHLYTSGWVNDLECDHNRKVHQLESELKRAQLTVVHADKVCAKFQALAAAPLANTPVLYEVDGDEFKADFLIQTPGFRSDFYLNDGRHVCSARSNADISYVGEPDLQMAAE